MIVILLKNPLFAKFRDSKNMINHAEKVDCGAIVREKFWHYFWQRTFSTESIVMPDPKPHLRLIPPSLTT
jgi:hypothetical protein